MDEIVISSAIKIPLTKGKYCLIDREDYDLVSSYKWCVSSYGYAVRGTRKMVNGKSKSFIHYMHREIIGAPVGLEVDHINGDKLDNRRSNLRVCTRQQNEWNKPANIRSKTGYKGVFWSKQARKYASWINTNGKIKHLGFYESSVEAAKAYDNAALMLHGEFARKNV